MAKKKNNFYAVKKGKNPGYIKPGMKCRAQVEALVALYTKVSQPEKKLRSI